jgi:recombinational DNA repair protein (RecF pathway)
MLLAKGRNLDIVTQSQTIDGFLALKSDLWRTSCGLYILELIDSFTMENSENRPLFNLLLDTLRQLCQVDSKEIVLRYFELHLLHYLGYRPQLHRCVMCNSPLKPGVNFFSASQGGVLCPHCNSKESRHYELFAPCNSDSFALCHSEGARRPKNLAQDRLCEAISLRSSFPLSVDALKVLRLWQDCDYATARRVKLKSELSSQLEQALQGYIVYLLQQQVKSMAWLEELKNLTTMERGITIRPHLKSAGSNVNG